MEPLLALCLVGAVFLVLLWCTCASVPVCSCLDMCAWALTGTKTSEAPCKKKARQSPTDQSVYAEESTADRIRRRQTTFFGE